MLALIESISAELVHLFFVSVLVAFSVLVGQSLYEYANKIDRRVEKKIKDRKHPDIKYVLYDIFWAPLTLVVVLILIRIGLGVLPPGSISQSLTALMDTLLFFTMIWFAVRIIKEVFQLADTDLIDRRTKA